MYRCWFSTCQVALLVLSTQVFAQELPKERLMDLNILQLQIGRTELKDVVMVFRAPSTWIGVKSDEDHVLVVVTLTGRVPRPCQITVLNDDFQALYEDTDRDLRLVPSKVIASGENSNFFEFPERHAERMMQTFFFYEAGPVTLRVVFLLPKAVKQFSIRYPALARGTALVAR